MLKRKRKSKEERVTYRELEKGKAFHLKIGSYDVVAVNMPEYENLEAKAGVAIAPAKVEGGYGHKEHKVWTAFVLSEDHGLLPLETWKNIVSNTISTATATRVTDGDVQVVTTTRSPLSLKCPECGHSIPYLKEVPSFCSHCGEKIVARDL